MKIALLDLGGVVFNFPGSAISKINLKVLAKLSKKYGYDLDIGKDVFDLFLKEYNLESNQNLSKNDFLKSVFDSRYFNYELVDFLKENFEIVILSDNYRENIKYISKRYNFSDWSKKQFYSYDYGITKAEKKLFLKVLNELKVKAEDCIFIDDKESNVKNANDLGIKGIVFKNNKKTFEEINKIMAF